MACIAASRIKAALDPWLPIFNNMGGSDLVPVGLRVPSCQIRLGLRGVK